MPTRISGACNGCRTKKQKCSGDRGPAKGYIEGLEHRLHEAESLLLALLPIISIEQLKCATDSLADGPSTINIPGLKTRDSQSPGPHALRTSPPVLNKKTGIDYWESFPLDTVENIRKWQNDCAAHSGAANGQTQSLRNSIDDSQSHTNILAALNHGPSHSRPASVDLSRHGHGHNHSHSQSAPFRSMSSDSYRSGASTPIHMPQHSHSQPSLPTTSGSQQQSSQQQTSTPNWQSLTLFSPNTTTSSPNVTSSPSAGTGAGVGAEALLLQSFADSSWAQAQTMNSGMGMGGMGNGLSVESGPMEVDTGFFSSDMQRRLFW
ncbi:hypothetical protein G647_03580 [Cladophialophora carrionii CBS 160.54]|uniref:Zn(2)-C6 fungal-type domain-containing protein n=1 Tax=Cladophialophora carrionii CBS 160.54 TaxID=1279043 RepID=V9DBX9_9EURO|nr:uncharacterized protein G647_03580 [Cladophialophora carrionii CBS 160.54]ETI24211.1 hypothetical protein G647_03580 [Cladophialophora carrionii CBS 160.54]